ncbi:MAG: SpoIIE family protein phosphatase [Candidatus Riflebacteria bacterium]|nr:SpoIIE family protein phosphatase [Candidatus Riflebacteria bacterium]
MSISVNSNKIFTKLATSLELLIRTALFVGLPVLMCLVLVHDFEKEAIDAAKNNRCSEMRAVLNRIAIMGNPEKHFAERMERLTSNPIPPRVLAVRAARIARSENGAMDLFVFDASGSIIPLPGFPMPPKAASQAFLKGLLKLTPHPNANLIAAFAGNKNAVNLLAPSPGIFINLQNGFNRSFCGWWPVNGRNGTPIAWVVAFLHKGKIEQDSLVDRAVLTARRLVGTMYYLGWRHPAASETIRPPLPDTPHGLLEVLCTTSAGIETCSFRDRELVTQCSAQGELLFCLSRNLPFHETFYSNFRILIIFIGITAAVTMFIYAGGIFPPFLGFRGKLVLLLLASGVIILGGLLGSIFADRNNRERELVRQFETDHVNLLEKLDRASASENYRFFRTYDEFTRKTMGQSLSELRRQIPALSSFVKLNSSAFISIILVDLNQNIIYESNPGAAGNSQSKLAFQMLRYFQHQQEGVRGESQGDSSMITDVLVVNLYWAYRSLGSFFRQKFLGQDVFFVVQPINGPDGKPHALLLGLQDALVLEMQALARIRRNMNAVAANGLHWAALPVSPDTRWQTFPRSNTGRNPVLKQVRDQVLATQLPAHTVGFIHNCEYLVTALRGHVLDGYVLILARPFSIIRDMTLRLNLQAAGLSASILILGLAGAFLASSMLLAPLHDLTRNLTALTERHFNERVPPCAVVELSRVGERFNSIMENLYDLKIARTVQENLWPGKKLSGPGWSVEGRCCTAAGLGGDHHEWFTLPDGRIVIAIGDVAGHGVPAALVAAAAKVELALNAERSQSPGAILCGMNSGLLEQAGRSRPMTFWLGIFDPGTRQVRFADAGHLFGIVLPVKGGVEHAGAAGYPLGSRKIPAYQDDVIDLASGGRLVLYSDGFIEAVNAAQEQFGFDRFLETILPLRSAPTDMLINDVFTRIANWSQHDFPDDDQTLVVLTVAPVETSI